MLLIVLKFKSLFNCFYHHRNSANIFSTAQKMYRF